MKKSTLNGSFFPSNCPSGQLKCNFDNPTETISSGCRESFARLELINVLRKMFPGHVESCFDNPAEKFQPKNQKERFFAQHTKMVIK